MKCKDVLLAIAKKQFAETEFDWLSKKLHLIEDEFSASKFYLAFSGCSRFLSKEHIVLSRDDLSKIHPHYPNFQATPWSKDEIGRILMTLSLSVQYNEKHLTALFETADYRELIALYKGLYFLENAEDFALRAREGLRTNMVGVFDAIALYNPYPYKYLPQDAWNHMVLKAMFMERPIYKIYKIEERKNKELALIFLDYAHERWSAHRKVSPELWRFVSDYADERFFDDIKRVIDTGDRLESLAAARALVESDYSPGIKWLAQADVKVDELPDWNEIGQQLEKEKQATL